MTNVFMLATAAVFAVALYNTFMVVKTVKKN